MGTIYHAPENISGTNLSRCRFTTVIGPRFRVGPTFDEGVSENHRLLILHSSSLITLETC